MPTYEYRCNTCGDFDLVHSMSQPAEKKCPTCGGQIERLISSTAGRGFYIDEMEPTYHHAACKYYTSKSEYRRVTKLLGFEEVGDQTNWTPKPDPYKEQKREQEIKEEVEKAYNAVKEGSAPLTDYDKHRCKIINHNLKHNNYDRRELGPDGKPRA